MVVIIAPAVEHDVVVIACTEADAGRIDIVDVAAGVDRLEVLRKLVG